MGDACLTLPTTQFCPGSSVPNPPMRKCPVADNGSKAANQRANFAVSLPQRFILESWPCWLLAQLAHTRQASWSGAKQMARFTKKKLLQKNIG